MVDTPSSKLAVILHADVVGSTTLVQLDEVLAHERIRDTFLRFSDAIRKYNGTAHEIRGDALVAEFSKASDAVIASIAFQADNASHNAGLTDDVRPEIRIGIAMGEVVVADSTVTGEGVVLAQRLEQLAQPGCVVTQGAAYETVPKRLPFNYESLGERQLKGFSDPVKAYSVSLKPGADIPGSEIQSKKDVTALDLPDKPSIAVLPFANMSDDPEQEYFADGMSEDIITELSKFRSLFVIARNSSFAFKGQSVEVKDVSRKLGVRYVVEGSVRRVGARVRITAQLIDAIADNHIWAERYDRNLEDIFAVQDEVTEAIVTTIEPRLISTERQRARRKPPESLSAWECYQRGMWHIYQYSAEDTQKALDFLYQAIDLDPNFASAHAGIAFAMYAHILMEGSTDHDGDVFRGLQAGLTAVALDENDPFAHVGLGRIQIARAEHDQALACCDRAIALNPSFAVAHYVRAHGLWHCGRAAEAIVSHEEAMRLSPRDPLAWTFLASKAIALVMLKRYEEALECSRQAQKFPITAIWAYMGELSTLGLLDRKEEAHAALERARKLKPDLSLHFIKQTLPITDAPSREHFLDGLSRAGVPN